MKPSRVVKTGLKVEAPWHWNQVGSENRLKVKALWHWNQVGSENRLKVKARWHWNQVGSENRFESKNVKGSMKMKTKKVVKMGSKVKSI